jgi:hypothetical protein
MIRKKKEIARVGNSRLELVRLQHMLQAAKDTGDEDKVQDLMTQIDALEAVTAPSKNASVDLIAKLNAKNKELDFKEGRESYLQALVQKRQQGRLV